MNTKTKILNQRNNELHKKLNKENNNVVTDVVCYLRVANISEYDQETVRQDLLHMVLSAQERGENMKAVIGEDYKSFCNDVINALPEKTKKERILNFIDTILLCTSILGAINIVTSKETIELIHNVVTGQQLNLKISVKVGSLLSYVLILTAAFLIVQVICKISLEPVKKHEPNKFKISLAGGLIGGCITIAIFIITRVGKQTLFSVNIFISCIVVLILYAAHKYLQKII